jgi:hypothetical protein
MLSASPVGGSLAAADTDDIGDSLDSLLDRSRQVQL